MDPADSRRLYAGTHKGLYLSSDGAKTWELVETVPQISVRAVASGLADPQRLYIATDQGLWESPDRGVTWRATDSRCVPVHYDFVAAHPADDRMLLAIQGSRSLVRSTDQGLSWKPLLTLAANQLAFTIAIDPYDPQRLFVGTTRGLYASTDGGNTWDLNMGGIAANEVRQVVDAPGTKGQLYVVTPAGIMETVDGGKTWQGRNRGLAEPDVLALAIDPQDRRMVYAVTRSGDVWRSQNGGGQWTLTEHPLPSGSQANRLLVWRPEETAESVLYVATENSGVLRSLDHGDHWETLNHGLPAEPVRGMALSYGRGSWIYVGAGADIYRLAVGATAVGGPTMGASDSGTSQRPGQRSLCLLACTPDSLCCDRSRRRLSPRRERDSPWESVSQEILPFAVPVRALWVSSRPWQQPLLWVITDAGLFSSDNQGSTWSLSSLESVQQGGVRCLATDDRAPEDLYVGTARSGLYRGHPTTTPIVSSVGYLLLVAVAFGGLAGLVKGRDILHRYWQSRSRLLLEQNWQAWNAIIDDTMASHDVVTSDLLERIEPDSRTVAMRSYVHNRQDQALLYREQPPAIEPQRLGDLTALSVQWLSLLEKLSKPSEATPIAAQLTERICEMLGFEPLESRAFRSLFGYLVQAPTLRLGLPSRFPIVFVLESEWQRTDVQDIRDLMSVLRATAFFALVVLIDETPTAKEEARSLATAAGSGADDFIFLNYNDLRSLFLARDPRRRLVDAILEQADLTLVSPYVTSGPVPDNMFFGRDYEIKAIIRTIRDRNYAILGGRKIGKTSVLTKLHRMLEQTSGFRPYYVDCEHIFDYRQLLSSLALACQPPSVPVSVDDLRHLAVCLRRQNEGKTIVFLFDEIDHLLTFDGQNQYHLFQMMRALTTEGLCRFIFCGERVLHRACHDSQHPLSSIIDAMELGCLSQRDALRIVTEPMDAMGVSFETEGKLPERVVALASGHPNLVQAICQMLIGRVNTRQDRIVWTHDLAVVQDSQQFSDCVMEVVWGNTNTIGRLITVLMAHISAFGAEDVRLALLNHGYRISRASLEETLRDLVLLSVLRQRGEQYTFAAQAFTAIMSDPHIASGFSEGLLEELRDEEPLSFDEPLQAQPPQSRSDGAE